MADRLRVPGTRDVRATLDGGDADAVVVACPPHPQMGGDRRDPRLRAVSDALRERGVDCVRIDYGPWDEGRGEQTDARDALSWARERYAAAGLFGYSFGGAVALLATAAAFREGAAATPDAISVLAPASSLGEFDVVGAVEDVRCPLQVVYGERDTTVDSRPIAERASERGGTVESFPADHFYVGQRDGMAESVASFFGDHVWDV